MVPYENRRNNHLFRINQIYSKRRPKMATSKTKPTRSARSRKSGKQTTDQLKPMRVLFKGSCTSLTGGSTLTYHIGTDDQNALQVAITNNDGGGFYNRCWTPYADILKLIKSQKGLSFPSYRLQVLFKGKSVNSPSFLAAVLRNENVIKVSETNKRMHQIDRPDKFLNRMQTLIDSTISMNDPLAGKTNLT